MITMYVKLQMYFDGTLKTLKYTEVCMGRFLKELKYSIVMKKHIFFIVLVGFVACGAAWLFQDTLREDLKKSFPSTYDLKNASTMPMLL